VSPCRVAPMIVSQVQVRQYQQQQARDRHQLVRDVCAQYPTTSHSFHSHSSGHGSAGCSFGTGSSAGHDMPASSRFVHEAPVQQGEDPLLPAAATALVGVGDAGQLGHEAGAGSVVGGGVLAGAFVRDL
jgi:hypothetical protein